METVTKGKANPTVKECTSKRDEHGKTIPWSGAHSFTEALSYLKDGWKDGIHRLKEFQKGIPPDLYDCIMPVKEYKPELQHGIAGGTLDIGTYLTGATPDNFIKEVIPHDDGKQIVKGRKLQTVYMNIANSSCMDEKAFFYRGAYTFSMVEHLENCGYSVELWVVNCVKDWNKTIQQFTYTKVKEFGELFDTNKLAISLCSNFMLRRFIFSIQEQGDDEEIRDIQRGAYGCPCSPTIDYVALPEDMDLNPMWIGTVNESDPVQMLERFRKILDEHVNNQTIQE